MNLFEQIEGLVSNKLATMKTILSIFKLEARLAGLSIFPLILNVCLLFIIIITLWLSTMVIIGYVALLFLGTFLPSIFLILILNLVLFIALLRYLSFNLKSMSFEKTRAFLSPAEDSQDDKPKKEVTTGHYKSGKKIAGPNPTSSNP